MITKIKLLKQEKKWSKRVKSGTAKLVEDFNNALTMKPTELFNDELLWAKKVLIQHLNNYGILFYEVKGL